jgi:hypothetical protein
MGVYDDLSKLDTESPTPRIVAESNPKKKRGAIKKKTSVDQSIDQSTDRPVIQSTNRSTDQLSRIEALGPIVDRPRAFYITLKVDRWLDEAVRYLKDKGMHKMDRSVLLNALIHTPTIFEPKSLDTIRNRLLAHLTNKSLKREESIDQSTS